jgi:hypothetical protein
MSYAILVRKILCSSISNRFISHSIVMTPFSTVVRNVIFRLILGSLHSVTGWSWRLVLDTVRQQFPQTTLWRRQMVLGPGKEFALMVPLGVNVPTPSGWSALAIERVRIDVPESR